MDPKEITYCSQSEMEARRFREISAWGRIDLCGRARKKERLPILIFYLESIVKFMGQVESQGKNVVLGVNNQDIIVRFATFPKVPDDKIRSMVRMLRLKTIFPYL